MAQKYYPLEQNWQYDSSEESDDELQVEVPDVSVGETLEEIRNYYGAATVNDITLDEQVENLSSPSPITQEDDANSAFNNAVDQLKDSATGNKRSCASCAKPRRVTTVSSFKKGQHISMPGQYSTKYFKPRRRIKNAYTHHAIVKKINNTENTSIEMVLMHFTQVEGKISVFETTEKYDLREKEIYIVEYIYPRYDPDKIVARAESVLKKEQEGKFKSYHIFKQNCEHFATWCVVGEGESFQVQGLREKIASAVQKLFGVGSKIAKGILRLLFISADEIASGLSKAAPDFVLGGTAALYLIYCIVMTALHVRDYNNSQICWSCLKGKLQDLWLSFGAFGVTSALTFIILHFAIPLIAPGIGIPLMILLILLSLAFQWSVPKIRKALQGPFTVDKQKNTSLADIKVGDVVTFKFGPTKIVTDVKFENDTPNKGVIRVVHYVIPSLLQKKIVEEYFHVDLAKKSIYVFDCTPLRTYSTDMVVSRARSRIGETKWKMFSNRSDHFCYWAKIQDDSDSIEEELDQNPSETESKKLSSVFVDKTEIHLMDEIQVGDVIESSEIGFFRDTGIVVAIHYSDQDNDRKIRIDVCVYDFSWTVRKKTIEINLNEDRIYVKKYHPAHCHPIATRARKARGLIDKEGKWWTSTGFIEHCIMRNPE